MPRRRLAEDVEYLHTTIAIPREWRNKIEEYMRRKGYRSLAELLRELLRRFIEEMENEERHGQS